MTKSIFKEKYPLSFNQLKENINCDILIIGAGIAGLSTAYELLSLRKKIVIVDQNRIYQSTSTSTTAKITAQHGFFYHDLIKSNGIDDARLFYDLNTLGIKRINEIIKRENIDCDFNTVNSYLFAESDLDYQLLLFEHQAYKKLNIPTSLVHIDSRISRFKALKLENQANFNVQKYLKGLTDVLLDNGVIIYENTKIVKTNKFEKPNAITKDNFKIDAKYIIIASHYPVYRHFNSFFLKLIPYYSYSIVSKDSNHEIEDANYINVSSESTIAIRYIKDNESKKLNISGQSHEAKVFSNNEEFDIYETNIKELVEYSKKHFGITEFDYTWETQDYSSYDLLPFVGYLDESTLIITAFNKWGMASSVASSIVLKDLINTNDSKYKSLLNPRRFKLNLKLLSYGLVMPKTLIKTRIFPTHLQKQRKNEGGVFNTKEGAIGIYIDDEGKEFKVKAICPHMHCGLRFNNLEKTYDCKCHGSRFNYLGEVLDGPAKKDLERI